MSPYVSLSTPRHPATIKVKLSPHSLLKRSNYYHHSLPSSRNTHNCGRISGQMHEKRFVARGKLYGFSIPTHFLDLEVMVLHAKASGELRFISFPTVYPAAANSRYSRPRPRSDFFYRVVCIHDIITQTSNTGIS